MNRPIFSNQSNSTATSSSSSTLAQPLMPAQPDVKEYSIRVPKVSKKKYHVMQFGDNVDFTQWRNVKMERENNMKEFKGIEEEMPKFGAGSEYNRDLREEAKRKRAGIIAKKYQPEAQPWILKSGGKSGKKFRGQREGGVSQNASFYVFTHATDGAIEAYPLNEWYNFRPINRYKALSAEEAEAEFSHRKKVLNYFSLMLKKRLKGDEEDPEDKEEAKAKKGAKKTKDQALKISDMDEDAWMDSDDNSSESDEDKIKEKKEDSDNEKKKKDKKKKPGAEKKKKKKKDSDDEAFEESDDGDEEGRELDYISDSSDSESEPETKPNKELKGVAEEEALTSDEDSDEEEKKSDEENENDEEKKKEGKEKEKDAKDGKDGKQKKKKKNKKKIKDSKTNSSDDDFSSDSSDSDGEKNSKKKKSASANNSRSGSPLTVGTSNKRKAPPSNSMPSDLTSTVTASDNSNSPTATPAKKPKIETNSTLSVPSTFAGVINNNKEDYASIEDSVRRYLMRKPMTTKELLTKFKNKKSSGEKLLETMTQILKKINPTKQTIQGKLYLSIKAPK